LDDVNLEEVTGVGLRRTVADLVLDVVLLVRGVEVVLLVRGVAVVIIEDLVIVDILPDAVVTLALN